MFKASGILKVMLKKFLIFFANSVMSLSLFLAATFAVILITFTGPHIKSWLEKADVYNTVVPAVLDQASTLVNEDGDPDHNNPFNDEGVKQAAKDSITPEFLRSNVEMVIDSVTVWLKGETPRPDFVIELGGVKDTFASNVGTYAADRYAALPECEPGQVPTSDDVLQIECKVPGYDPTADIEKAVGELKNGEEFLADTTISADDIKLGEEGDSEPLFTKIEQAPQAYQGAQWIPVFFGIVALGSALVVLFASPTKRRGVRVIASTITPVGLVLFLEAWLANLGVSRIQEEVARSVDSSDGLKNVALAVVQALGQDMAHWIMVFAAIITGLGLSMIVALILTRQKADTEEPHHTPHHDHDIAAKPSEEHTNHPGTHHESHRPEHVNEQTEDKTPN